MFVASYRKPGIYKDTKTFVLRLSLFVILLAWCIGFFSPAFNSQFSTAFRPFLDLVYSRVCHQDPAKTFSINGSLLLVCARCTGIYLGAFFTITVLLLTTIKLHLTKKILIISGLPMLLDVISYSIGFYNYSKILAFVTGFIFGCISMWFLIHFLEENLIKEKFYE